MHVALPAHPVEGLGNVAGGPYVRQVGPHAIVYPDAPADIEARSLEERYVGLDARCRDIGIRDEVFATDQLHTADSPAARKPQSLGVFINYYAATLKVVTNEFGGLLIEQIRHQPFLFDNRYV